MRSKTVAEMELLVRSLLGDNTNYTPEVVGEVAGNTWSSAMVIDAINFACQQYCRKTNATYTVASLSASAGVFPGVVLNEIKLPTDYLDIVRVTVPTQAISVTPYTSPGLGLLIETTKAQEAIRNPFWEQQVGTKVKKWFEKDGRTIGITPSVSTSGYSGTAFHVAYIQAPSLLTSTIAVSVGSLEVGKWYQIVSVGDTDFTDVGAADSVVGTQFQATDTDDGTGTTHEVIDARIIPAHQDYLKYLAAAYLCGMSSDQQSLALAEKYTATFNSLV